MNRTFFTQLCPGEVAEYEDLGKDYTILQPNCFCDGTNFYGMPDLSLSLYVDEYATGKFYELKPKDYEMFPKIGRKI